ncbi:MAG: DUF4321 domain-containing protein [bacterium]
MPRRYRMGVLVLWLAAGAVIGSVVGQLFGLILPEGVVRQFFLTGTNIGFGPGTLDLAVMSVTVGFRLTINVVGVLGILFAGYYFRWYQ